MPYIATTQTGANWNLYVVSNSTNTRSFVEFFDESGNFISNGYYNSIRAIKRELTRLTGGKCQLEPANCLEAA